MMTEINLKENEVDVNMVVERGINFQRFCDIMGYDQQTLAIPHLR